MSDEQHAPASESATLRDGQAVLIRPLRSDDRDLLRAGFDQLGPESRYRRFFFAKSQLSESELSYLCDVDGHDHFAIGAVCEHADGEVEPLGIARFVRLTGEPEVAEPAIAVIDAMQGKGLGKLLLHRLADAALARGVHYFRCTVLSDNEVMQQLLSELDSEATASELSHGVRQVDLSLRPRSDDPASLGPLHILERLMSHSARGLVRVRSHG